MAKEKICTIEGCGRLSHPDGRGYRYHRYCTTHHRRVTIHGDPYADVPIDQSSKSLAKRRARLQAEADG